MVHATGATIPLAYLLFDLPWFWVQVAWSVAALGGLLLEALRLSGVVNWRLFDTLTREYEQENLAGYALYLLSMAAVAWLFPPSTVPGAAVAGMLMLALGDPVSGLVGSGELQSVKGAPSLLAMFAVCLAIAFGVGLALAPAVVGAAAATLADGVKPVVASYVVDDNLTIPPAAAVGVTLGWLLPGVL
ncbi:dolichol kinase [Halomarina oriensis]|uniref:Dolichol kinase n=1 Tax=Halomarina oriensis TaxID=671145 RepID=A0A6B0GLK1_9EURY|nr:dolichol kinase [Halomarina oriensis]MWG34761.1 dolichol kinase [Halomarina oriensis]